MRRCFPSDKKGGFSMDKNKLKSYAEKFDKELYSSVEPFWTKYGMDKTYGGMTTCLDRFGKIYSTDKSVWMQGRAACSPATAGTKNFISKTRKAVSIFWTGTVSIPTGVCFLPSPRTEDL